MSSSARELAALLERRKHAWLSWRVWIDLALDVRGGARIYDSVKADYLRLNTVIRERIRDAKRGKVEPIDPAWEHCLTEPPRRFMPTTIEEHIAQNLARQRRSHFLCQDLQKLSSCLKR